LLTVCSKISPDEDGGDNQNAVPDPPQTGKGPEPIYHFMF